MSRHLFEKALENFLSMAPAIEAAAKKFSADVTNEDHSFPEEYKNVKSSDVPEKLLEFVRNKDLLFCWIYGGTGTGKTHALHALRKYQIERGFLPVRIIKEIDLTHETSTRGPIAIDDVGLSTNPNRLHSLIETYFSIIEKKYESGVKIIFTSNFSIADWLNKNMPYNADICKRIGSRMSNNRMEILLDGIDQRKYPKQGE